MHNITPQEGASHMYRRLRSCWAFAAVLVALALVIAGCSQSDSTADRAGEAAAKGAGSPQPEQAAPGESELAETAKMKAESGVKLATAESHVPPPGESPAERAETEETDRRLQPPRKLAAAEAPLPLDNVDAADLTMPEVSLTEQHAATCRVRVGEKFPDLQLPDTAGQQQSLSRLLGDKLTLVVFWNSKEPTSLEELADLGRYHQPRFGDRGLAIVAVNTGDKPQLAAELAKQAGAEFTILSDADGAAFQQVATAKIPRSYLLDPSGTVLWFDLEYSPTTQRDLAEAIRYSLARE
jgi:peroxiredoxin